MYSSEFKYLNSPKTISVALGVDNERTEYDFTITGYPSTIGNGSLGFELRDGSSFKGSLRDSILIVELP